MPRAHGDIEGLYPVNTPQNLQPGYDTRFFGRPAIWTIVDQIGLEMGCGNGHQCQVTAYDGLADAFADNQAYEFVLKHSTCELTKPIFIGRRR